MRYNSVKERYELHDLEEYVSYFQIEREIAGRLRDHGYVKSFRTFSESDFAGSAPRPPARCCLHSIPARPHPLPPDLPPLSPHRTVVVRVRSKQKANCGGRGGARRFNHGGRRAVVLPATARTSRDTAVAWLLGVMNALPLTIYIDHTTAAQQSWFFITYGIIMQPWQWQCDAAKEREIQMASARMLQRTTARTAHTSPIYGCHIRFVCRCVSIR